MVKRFDWLLVCLLFSIGVMAQSGGKQYNSYKGLVMAGYQGSTPLVTARAVVGIIIMGAMGFVRGHVRWTFGRKYRSIRSSIRLNFPLLTVNRLMFFLLMMNLR